MKKPPVDFFVIGAARSGTTSLYRVLEQHPDIFVPQTKEPRFFAENWSRGWDWYREIYANAPKDAKLGDFSPNYTNAVDDVHRIVPRMQRAYPNAKIVYMVRNPIACAISNWRMTAELLGYELPFGEALEHKDWATTVYHRACFFRQISFYREAFGDENILTIPLEWIRADPDPWIAKLHTHLGVTPQNATLPKANASNRKPNRPLAPEITRAERMKFIDMVGEDAKAMLEYMGEAEKLWPMGPSSSYWTPKTG